MSMERSHVELLSPAGDYECFKAAMTAGADAVYLGLKRFSARANAANLSSDELYRALDTSHVLGKKIYLTVNTLFKDEELDELYDELYEPYIRGLDGVIVQDIGAMSRIKRLFSDLPIHVSTQAAVTGSDGALYLKRLGATRIVPARELSLKEIKLMRQKSLLEIECFVHGSLCYSYSGKCLMSSFIGGRSGNRGRCAGPCRLPYDGSYPLSLKDLCAIDMIPELVDAGISSFKIEGRMKSSAYVYGVTSIYRKYIDRYYDGSLYTVDKDDRVRLISYYTRGGNCSGYYKSHNSRRMITLSSPSYSTDTDKESADTFDAAADVDIRCEIRKGKSILIWLKSMGYETAVDTHIIPDTSINRSLTAESVSKQLKKTGGTDFRVRRCEVIADDGLFLPNGILNGIRRAGLDALKEKMLSSHMRIPAPQKEAALITSHSVKGREHTLHFDGPAQVRAGITDRRQIDAAMSSEADGLIVPVALFMSCEDLFCDTSKMIYISLPYIVRDEAGACDDLKKAVHKLASRSEIKGFYISNHESAMVLEDMDYDGEITADIHMYAYNREAYEFFCKKGIKTTVPVELNRHELIRRGIRGEDMIIYGKLPVMISANCLYNTKNGCHKVPEGHAMYMTDRRGAKFYTVCDCAKCENVIYNSVPLSISDEKSVFEDLSPSVVRLMFTDEDPETVSDILKRYFTYKNPDASTDIKLTDSYTKGHLNRGVE